MTDPELLTKKRVLINIYNEYIDLIARQEIDLEMNEILVISDSEEPIKLDNGQMSTKRAEREKQIIHDKRVLENNVKILEIIQRKFLEEDEKGKKLKTKGKEKNAEN